MINNEEISDTSSDGQGMLGGIGRALVAREVTATSGQTLEDLLRVSRQHAGRDEVCIVADRVVVAVSI